MPVYIFTSIKKSPTINPHMQFLLNQPQTSTPSNASLTSIGPSGIWIDVAIWLLKSTSKSATIYSEAHFVMENIDIFWHMLNGPPLELIMAQRRVLSPPLTDCLYVSPVSFSPFSHVQCIYNFSSHMMRSQKPGHLRNGFPFC